MKMHTLRKVTIFQLNYDVWIWKVFSVRKSPLHTLKGVKVFRNVSDGNRYLKVKASGTDYFSH